MPRYKILLQLQLPHVLTHIKLKATTTTSGDSYWQHHMLCHNIFLYVQLIKDFQEGLLLSVKRMFLNRLAAQGQTKADVIAAFLSSSKSALTMS